MKYLVLLVLGLLVGCESKTDSTPAQEPNNVSENNDNADLVALRQAVVENHAVYIHETLSEFETQSKELQSAVNAWQASGSASDLESAISEFHEAMDVWQRAEVLQVGPAGVMGTVAGGEDLRDQIYSWPLSNACRVDQELVRLGYESDFASQAVNVRGLDALEYLLFAEGTSNACPINSMINTDGQWAALGEEEIRERRRAYAKAATDLVVTSAEDLSARWAEDGSFRAQFTDPTSGQVFFQSSVREETSSSEPFVGEAPVSFAPAAELPQTPETPGNPDPVEEPDESAEVEVSSGCASASGHPGALLLLLGLVQLLVRRRKQ